MWGKTVINRQVLRDASGATAMEYGLMIALLAIAAIPAIGTMDEEVSNTYSEVDTSMAEHGGLASAPGIGASSGGTSPVFGNSSASGADSGIGNGVGSNPEPAPSHTPITARDPGIPR